MNHSAKFVSGNIPTSQEPLALAQVRELAEFVDSGLAELEEKFAQFTTPSSLKNALKRAR